MASRRVIDAELIERKWWRRWDTMPDDNTVIIEVGERDPVEVARVTHDNQGDLEGLSRFISNAPVMYRLLREVVFDMPDSIASVEWMREARDLVNNVEGDEENYKNYILGQRSRKIETYKL